MKNILLNILILATLFSCSGNKEVVHRSSDTEVSQSRAVSLGPRGKIISNKEVEHQNQQVAAQEVAGDEAVVEFKDADAALTEPPLNGIAQELNESEELNPGAQSAEVENASQSKEWEPYRKKSNENKSGNRKKNGFAIAGFVTSFFYFLFPAAIVFSALGLKSEKRGLAIAGLIISCIWAGLFIAAIFYAYFL